MQTAIEFGIQHQSCEPAMKWRHSLPANATQSDAYLACERGDWLLWQLEKIGIRGNDPRIQRALTSIVERAIRRALSALEGESAQWAADWRLWATRWLDGTDRSAWAASTALAAMQAAARAADAARAAAWAAALAAEAAEASLVTRADTARAAAWAAETADVDDAKAEELRAQAADIRREIPEWPGE